MKTNQPRETTARFNTTECRLILRHMKTAAPILSADEEKSWHTVVKRLEHRIETEDKKNANGTGNQTGA